MNLPMTVRTMEGMLEINFLILVIKNTFLIQTHFSYSEGFWTWGYHHGHRRLSWHYSSLNKFGSVCAIIWVTGFCWTFWNAENWCAQYSLWGHPQLAAVQPAHFEALKHWEHLLMAEMEGFVRSYVVFSADIVLQKLLCLSCPDLYRKHCDIAVMHSIVCVFVCGYTCVCECVHVCAPNLSCHP